MTPERVPTDPNLDTSQALQMILDQLTDLAERVSFLEKALLPGVAAPTNLDVARANAARSAASSLGADLEAIGSALDSVLTSIEENKTIATPPPLEPVVVDLSSGRRTIQRRDPNRQSGWQPH